MKIAVYVLAALLVAALGAAGFVYVTLWQPVMADYTNIKAGLPAMDKARADLKKYKEREAKETGWIAPAIDTLNTGLGEEIKAGTVEISAAGTAVIVNIAEKIVYTPGSVTFAQSSPPFRQKLAALLAGKEFKGKEITVINTTDSVPAQGKGRKKTPPKEARALAADRSVALARFLEQNKVEQEFLVAAAYSSKVPDTGFTIKDHKTTIIISNPPAPGAQPKPAPAAKPAENASAGQAEQPVAPKTIPIKPAQPKGQ